MSDQIKEEYGSWMENIQIELDAYEGEGPPSDEQLLSTIRYTTGGIIGRIESLEEVENEEYLKDTLQVLLGDVLEIRTAIEMIEERR